MFRELPRPDYEGREAEQLAINFADVAVRLESGEENLMKRIRSFSEGFGYSEEDVMEKIRNDRMFSAHFTIPPMKQSFHETVAHEWLEDTLELDVTLLPRNGRNAFYVHMGGNIDRWAGAGKPPVKSLDFFWEHRGKRFYAIHKYTRGSGGGQDNQFADVQQVLRNFRDAQDLNVILFAIVDGNYYTTDKMTALGRITNHVPPRSFAVRIEDVPKILNEHYCIEAQ